MEGEIGLDQKTNKLQPIKTVEFQMKETLGHRIIIFLKNGKWECDRNV